MAPVTVLFVLLGIAVIAGIGLVAVGRLGELPDAPPDRVPDGLGPDVTESSLAAARFDVGLRGYRMDEVDDLLDRLGDEIADRDTRIAEGEARIAELESRLDSQP